MVIGGWYLQAVPSPSRRGDKEGWSRDHVQGAAGQALRPLLRVVKWCKPRLFFPTTEGDFTKKQWQL